MNLNLKYAELTDQIINCAFEVHKILGAGFLEKVYENAMIKELELRGITDTMKNKIFDEEAMHLLEEDELMAYVSGFRQRAINEGELKGLMEGLMGMIEIKFGSVPSEFQKKMHEISELSKLEKIKEGIKRATDFEQVRKLL